MINYSYRFPGKDQRICRNNREIDSNSHKLSSISGTLPNFHVCIYSSNISSIIILHAIFSVSIASGRICCTGLPAAARSSSQDPETARIHIPWGLKGGTLRFCMPLGCSCWDRCLGYGCIVVYLG